MARITQNKPTSYTLPISLQNVKIVMVDGLASRHEDECWGEFSDNQGVLTISLDSSLKGPALRGSLYHEVFHMVLYISGISFIMEEKMEEAIVRSLENLFLPIKDDVDKLLIKLEKVSSGK